MPWAIRHYAVPGRLLPAGLSLQIGHIRFNPLTLGLDLRQIQLQRTNGQPLASIARIQARGSWLSLRYHLPILSQLRIVQPHLQLQRRPDGQLDIADLIAPLLAPSSGPSPPFAIANLQLQDGEIDLDDQVLKRQHRLDRLELAIPLLANVAAHGQPEVRPRLDLRMDGVPLHVEAVSQPFGDHLRTRVRVAMAGLDLPAYLPYLPLQLPLAIPSGRLAGQLELDYDAGSQPVQLQLHGQLQLQQLQLQRTDGQPLASVQSASLDLIDVAPLQNRYRLGKIVLQQPQLQLPLDAAGQPRLPGLWPPAASHPSAAATATPPLNLQLTQLQIQQGQLQLQGPALPRPLQLSALALQLDGLDTRAHQPAQLQVSSTLDHAGQLQLQAALRLDTQSAHGQLQIKQLALAPWQAWLPAAWRQAIALQGRLDSQLDFSAGLQPRLHWQLGPSQLTLHDVRVQPPGHTAPLRWQQLQLQLQALDPERHQLHLRRLDWQGLKLQLRQQAQSLDLLQGWPPLPGHAATSPAPATASWHWRLDQLNLQQAQVQLQPQASGAEPLQLQVKQLQLQHLSSQPGQDSSVQLQARTGHHGQIQAQGQLQLAAQTAQLQLQLDKVDLVPLQYLVPLPLHIGIRHARLSAKGQLNYSPSLQAYQGDADLSHVQILDLDDASDLLRFSQLQLDQVHWRRERGLTHLDIGQLGLAQFYARVIVNPDGHTNLSQLLDAPNQVVTSNHLGPAPAASQGGVSSLPTLHVSASLPLQLQIGGVRLLQGQLNYSDNFVQPHFNADITGLRGQIGRFGNTGGAPADLALFGTLNNLSPVLIEGKIDPLADSPYADVTGTANSVPLPRLSTYSSRYTGYPINSGLLNADVHYLLKDGKLQAQNHLLISQLTFGPAVTTPGVAHLPVKLAIALLKNSRGEIDIRLPVSGSLSDPQFSISDLFWHALRDLVGRAVSSPFRLLSSAFGGHEDRKDLGQLQFAPGSASLDATAVARLQKLVTMLQQRPALNLDITGRADPQLDTRGLREHWVDNEIRGEYHRQHIDASGPMPTLSAQEYHQLLVKVYHHDRFQKPRNFLGMETTPTDAAMAAAITAHAGIGPHQLENLASKRALAVAGWLHGKISDTRVLLHVPQIETQAAPDDSHHAKTPAAEAPATRVDLGLH